VSASFARIVRALTTHELRLAARRGESLLATFVIPVAVLWFFSSVALLPLGAGPAVKTLLPGAIGLSVIASSLVALGIATAYDRAYGVLKRLGGSPASRGAVVVAKILATLILEAVQVLFLLLVAALALGWSPDRAVDIPLLLAGIALGTAAFAGLGLLLAGTLRAEATLAVTNGLFLAAMLVGGIIVPVDHLPPWLAGIASVTPSAALVEVLRGAVGPASAGAPAVPLGILAGWAAVLVTAAAWRFRWE
jgi:ABC-2 type transport system permease protein